MGNSFGTHTQCILTDSDISPGSCHVCGSTNMEHIGSVYVGGNPQGAYRCGSCSVAVSEPSGGIKNFLNSSTTGGATFMNKYSSSTAAPVPSIVDLDYGTQNKKDMLNSSIQELSSQLFTLVEENKRIMEERKADPMGGLRKSIFDFNLE